MDQTRLIYMANQIARNLAARGTAQAIAATAQHLSDFWDPRMRAAIQLAPAEDLDPIARAAVEQLQTGGS